MPIKLRNLFVRPAARVVALEHGPHGQTLRLQVDGMVCDVCARRVRAALAGLPGVEEVEVDLQTGTAMIRAASGVAVEEAVEVVRGKVILPWARGLLARLPFLGRRQP